MLGDILGILYCTLKEQEKKAQKVAITNMKLSYISIVSYKSIASSEWIAFMLT